MPLELLASASDAVADPGGLGPQLGILEQLLDVAHPVGPFAESVAGDRPPSRRRVAFIAAEPREQVLQRPSPAGTAAALSVTLSLVRLTRLALAWLLTLLALARLCRLTRLLSLAALLALSGFLTFLALLSRALTLFALSGLLLAGSFTLVWGLPWLTLPALSGLLAILCWPLGRARLPGC